MVIGHIVGSAFNIAAKVTPKGSRIEVAKAVRMAQGISGHGLSPDDVAVGSRGAPIERAPIEPRGVITGKGKGTGTGSRGGTTKNDKTIDKKLNEKKKKVKKVNKSDKKRILQGKLPVVPRKTHYKSQSKNTPLVVKGSGVKATELKRSKLKPEQHDAHVKSYYKQVLKKDPNKWTEKEFKIAHEILDKERQPGFDYSDSGINLGPSPKTNIEIKWWKKYKPKSDYGKKIKQQVISGKMTSDEGHRAMKKRVEETRLKAKKDLLLTQDLFLNKLDSGHRINIDLLAPHEYGGGRMKTQKLSKKESDRLHWNLREHDQSMLEKLQGITNPKRQAARMTQSKIEKEMKQPSIFEAIQRVKQYKPGKTNRWGQSNPLHEGKNKGALKDGRFRMGVGQSGEQSYDPEVVKKWRAIGLGIGSAGTLGAGTLGSKNDRWGYW